MRNWTVPVGVPAPGATAVTVAVRTTVDPRGAGVPLVVTTVLLDALFTVWVRLALRAGPVVDATRRRPPTRCAPQPPGHW